MLKPTGWIYWLTALCCAFSAKPLAADHTDDKYTDARFIARNYVEGVVKILVYDPVVEKTFHLKKGDGYLTRGSGFFVSPEGYLFTNRHVVEWCVYGYAVADWTDDEGKFHQFDVLTYKPGLENQANIKKIYFVGHATPLVQVFKSEFDSSYDLYKAEVVSLGEAYDGAILKVVSDLNGAAVKRHFTALPLGNSDKVELGEDLVVLGYPSQYSHSDMALDLKDRITLSCGKHCGWDNVFDDKYGYIKTDAAIHEGNSGGPVFGDEETVIGIATAMGVRTAIGLVGGINGMFYVAKAQKELFKPLVKKGLTAPKEGGSFKALSGAPKPLPKLQLDGNPQTGANSLAAASSPTPLALNSSSSTLSLKGKVLQAEGSRPIANAIIKVQLIKERALKMVGSSTTDSQGTFLLKEPLAIGQKYQIQIEANGFKAISEELFLGSKDQGFLTVRLQK